MITQPLSSLCIIVPSCEAGGEYSVILANRSALWAELGEHELVVADVDHAIE